MGKRTPIDKQLDEVIECAYIDDGIPSHEAIRLARLASSAVCWYLMGTRVKFGAYSTKNTRNQAIYNAAQTGNSLEIARTTGLTGSAIRRIIKKQRQERVKNDKS
jgi:Mor family transcriptional regulator